MCNAADTADAMDEHSEERDEGSIMLAAMLDGSKKASRISKIGSTSASTSASASSSSRAATPAVMPVQAAPCCDVGLACWDTSLVCCTDQECSDDGKQQNSNNKNNDGTTPEDCPQCETAAKEDASTPCTDPGCQLLEWDEQAVDELVTNSFYIYS